MHKGILKYVPIFGMLLILITMPAFSGSAFGIASIASDKVPDKPSLKASPFQPRIIEYGDLIAIAVPLYTTLDDPAKHVTGSGGVFDGVGKLIIARPDSPTGLVGCSGTLLTTGKHVLTAAHCLTDSNGDPVWTSGQVHFEGDDGDITKNFASATIHPDWDGNLFVGNDIAVVEVVNEIPAGDITRYDLDRNGKDDKGMIGDKAGYGISGFLADGAESTTYPFGTKRDGQNKYDDHADKMLKALGLKPSKDFVRKSVLQYDGDDGTVTHDAFGFFFGNSDLGLTAGSDPEEANSASGDSGGPTFTKINNDFLITAITSYGLVLSTSGGFTTDCHPNLQIINEKLVNVPDSSCGEFSGDTSVSKYSDFIDKITGGGGDDGDTDPGPADKCNPGKARKGLCEL